MRSLEDDARLIARFLRGERDAVAALDGWTDVVFWEYARAVRDDWGDLKQEVRVRMLRNLGRGDFEGHSSLRTYVHRVAKNVCIDAIRSRRRKREHDMSLPADSPAFSAETRTEKASIAKDLLSKLLAEFSEDDRTLLELVFVEHCSYSEIAQRLAIPEGTVKSRMFRCKNQIIRRRRELMATEGGNV